MISKESNKKRIRQAVSHKEENNNRMITIFVIVNTTASKIARMSSSKNDFRIHNTSKEDSIV